MKKHVIYTRDLTWEKTRDKTHDKLHVFHMLICVFNHVINHVNIFSRVWLLKGGKPYKLANQYEGPYTIIEIVNNKGNAKIKMNNNKTKIVHVNRLSKPYIDQEN